MIAAVIPCHNEEKYIQGVVESTSRHVDAVIVVDNLSTDATAKLARLAGASVYSCVSKGMGNATKAGLRMSLAMGADYVVTLDGDGQHDPKDIPNLIVALKDHDLAIGCRDWSNMPRYRRVGNSILAWLAYAGKNKLKDSQCGMRALTKEVAEIETRSEGFGCVAELIIRARKAHYRIAEVPVSCVYHSEYGDNSTMSPFTHAASVAFSTLKWRAWEYLH